MSKPKGRVAIHIKVEPGERAAPSTSDRKQARKAAPPSAADAAPKPPKVPKVTKAKGTAPKVVPAPKDAGSGGAQSEPPRPGGAGIQNASAAEQASLMSKEELAAKNGLSVPDTPDLKKLLTQCNAATGKSDKALREAFKRSLPHYSDPRTQDAHVRKAKGEKMPSDMAATMVSQSDRDWWLGVWLTNKGSWLTAESYVDDRVEEVETSGSDRVWLIDAQMTDVFKDAEFVKEYQKQLKKNEKHHRKHPEMPWFERGHQYACVLNDAQRTRLKQILASGTKTTSLAIYLDTQHLHYNNLAA